MERERKVDNGVALLPTLKIRNYKLSLRRLSTLTIIPIFIQDSTLQHALLLSACLDQLEGNKPNKI